MARSAGLVNINNRWVGVNWLTMESTAAPGIHVLGDATFPAPLMPKSGHMANQHAKVAAAAIIQLLKGEPVNATPVVMNTCYSFVTAKRRDPRGLGAPVRRGRQDLQDRARLGRRVGGAPTRSRGATRCPGPTTSGHDMLGALTGASAGPAEPVPRRSLGEFR
jgi:hypothetical protein